MFKSWSEKLVKFNAKQSPKRAVSAALEPLEDRRLFSANFGGGERHGHGGGRDGGFDGRSNSTIAFSLAPSVVQTGLNTLATADGLTDPTATSLVHLNNVDGVETYAVTIDGTGTANTLTVDQLGDAVTAPTHTTTTWATLSGTGTGGDAAAATEITKIATALSVTAPVATITVDVTTTSAGVVTYSIHLSSSTPTTTTTDEVWAGFGTTVSVDAAGNPTGHQSLPFSVFSTTIQNGLNSHAPTGASALAATSTQNVEVATTDGITTYSTTFTVTGLQAKVTVNSAGTLTSLPTTATTTFSALSSAVQAELQTLATADGVTTAIAGTQSVTKLTETNGNLIYSVTLGATGTSTSNNSYTFDVTISVDSAGNPTTLPHNGFGFGDQGFGYGGFGYGGFGDGSFGHGPKGDCGIGGVGTNASSGSTTNASSGASTNASAGTISLPSASADSANATASSLIGDVVTISPVAGKLLSNVLGSFGMLSGYLVQFAISKVDSAILGDVTGIVAAQNRLNSDTKALSKTEKATLKADNKAIASAIKAMNTTLLPLEKTLKADAAKYAVTLKADLKAISKNKKNATALAAAKAQLASDAATAFSGVVTDGNAIESAIQGNSVVVTARAKLTTDLPTISSDQSAIISDQSQLVSDIKASLA